MRGLYSLKRIAQPQQAAKLAPQYRAGAFLAMTWGQGPGRLDTAATAGRYVANFGNAEGGYALHANFDGEQPPIVTRRMGRSLYYSGGIRQLHTTGRAGPASGLAPDETFIAVVEFETVTGTQAVVGYYSSNANDPENFGRGIYLKGGLIKASGVTSSNGKILSSGITAVAGQTYVIAVRFGVNGAIFVDGKKMATGDLSHAFTYNLAIGCGYTTSSIMYSLNGYVSLAYGVQRGLSDAELSLLSMNPWQLFMPQTRLRAIDAPAAGIAFDAAANSGYQAATATYTFDRTVAGSDRFLSVDVHILSVPGTTVTSVVDDSTGGAVAMTFIGARSTVSGAGRVECWGLVAPATGTKTIAVTLSASVSSAATAASYTGVHQTSPTEGFNSAQATNVGAADATVDITTVADNCWVHGACSTDDTAITANQTTRNNVTGALGSGANEDNNAAKTPAGAVTMSYTNVAGLATWTIAGYAIRPVAAAGLGAIIANAIRGAFSAVRGYFS